MEAKKHHGLLFADRLMPSMLDGSKTQTRRPVKPQPPSYIDALHGHDLRGRAPYDLEHPESGAIIGRGFQDDDDVFYKCHWSVGDLIWCRETWATDDDLESYWGGIEAFPDDARTWESMKFRATASDFELKTTKWRPSIHMPKWACRCWKEITDVRVQRIQEISEEDARAEGSAMRTRFIDSWSTIYPGSWEQNIWVWALTLKPAPQPERGVN